MWKICFVSDRSSRVETTENIEKHEQRKIARVRIQNSTREQHEHEYGSLEVNMKLRSGGFNPGSPSPVMFGFTEYAESHPILSLR